MATVEQDTAAVAGPLSPARGPHGAGSGDLERTDRRQYDWYCERQVSILLSMLPPGGVRSLYAHARAWAQSRAEHEAKDPMSTLRRYCREVLPLPPPDVWAEDYRANRAAYLDDDLEPPDPRDRREPVTIEVRSLIYRDQPWRAELRLFNDGDVWRGLVVFRAVSGQAFSTANVFCEPCANDIRERFLDFEPETLRAFLRSALP